MKTLEDLKNMSDEDIAKILVRDMSQFVQDTHDALGGREQSEADLKFVRAIRQKLGI